MPSPQQLIAIERRLEVRAAQLMQEIVEARTRGRADRPDDVTDSKDEADARALEQVDDASVERDLAELGEIRLARRRLALGTYGTCVSCAEAIDADRLAAQPQALRCMTCQTLVEQAVQGAPRGHRPSPPT